MPTSYQLPDLSIKTHRAARWAWLTSVMLAVIGRHQKCRPTIRQMYVSFVSMTICRRRFYGVGDKRRRLLSALWTGGRTYKKILYFCFKLSIVDAILHKLRVILGSWLVTEMFNGFNDVELCYKMVGVIFWKRQNGQIQNKCRIWFSFGTRPWNKELLEKKLQLPLSIIGPAMWSCRTNDYSFTYENFQPTAATNDSCSTIQQQLERHSVERIPPPRPLMLQNCPYQTNAR